MDVDDPSMNPEPVAVLDEDLVHTLEEGAALARVKTKTHVYKPGQHGNTTRMGLITASRDISAQDSSIGQSILEGAAVFEGTRARAKQDGAGVLFLAQCARSSKRRLHPGAHQVGDSRRSKPAACAAVVAVCEGTTRCYRHRAGESGCWMHRYHHPQPL